MVLLMRWGIDKVILPISKDEFRQIRGMDSSGTISVEVIGRGQKRYYPYQKDLAIVAEVSLKEAQAIVG